MVPESVKLRPEDRAEDAAQAFERYDLVSAPVVDLITGNLVGRVTVNDGHRLRPRQERRDAACRSGPAQGGGRLRVGVASFKNRWAWLAVNLVTAFIASRVIGAFEGSIEKLVALAALMPIVAGIGGNSGNQTITMIVRALALGQIQSSYWRKLDRQGARPGDAQRRDLGRRCVGVVAYLLYNNVALGGVMVLAMTLNLLLAAGMGVTIPYCARGSGSDPAVGSSVLITACTDSGGFFIFLGLATLFLL